jgi:hypothetical protein
MPLTLFGLNPGTGDGSGLIMCPRPLDVSDGAILAAAAAAFRLRCRNQKMKTMQPQRRARQPNVPPIIAPVVLGGLLVVGLGSGLVFVSVSASLEDDDEVGSGGVVLFG